MTEIIKVLLVDDKTENLFALESLLKTDQTKFYRATSGIDALELLLTNEFALALIDVQMPEMDGFELAELMRGTEISRAVPIIFVTAGAHNKQSTFKGYEKGAVDFLYKPLDSHVVRSKVQVFIELARQKKLLEVQLEETQRALCERDRALEQSKEALQSRDEFLSIASHELKTPITSLSLQLQLLTRTFISLNADVLPPELFARFNKGVDLCRRQTEKLSKLLDELLDLTRVRVGKLQLNCSSVDLVEITEEVVRRFLMQNSSERPVISVEVKQGPLRGHWDPLRIEQVVTNLVSNAIKYGEGKAISICLDLDPESKYARFEIRDQGLGIPANLQDKIFERFERAVKGGGISGLGLGLYITRQILDAHGGLISVKSEAAKGSVFTVLLPRSEL